MITSDISYIGSANLRTAFATTYLDKINALTDKDKEEIKLEAFKILTNIPNGKYMVLILRKDQVTDVVDDLLGKFKLIKFDLVHTSPDFANVNYMTGNYLNLYIFKVTYDH
jgi:hypothetical protein